MQKLTIGVPTFNRKTQLSRLLEGVADADTPFLEEVVIVDNSSEYDVNTVIPSRIKAKTRVVKNQINVGMSTNIVAPFLQCNTKWMWLISDDDIVLPRAIAEIEQELKTTDECCYYKFSSQGLGEKGVERDQELTGLDDFLAYFEDDRETRNGKLVFMSDGVFDLELLRPYLAYSFMYSYTFIGYLVPVIRALKSGLSVKMSDRFVCEYRSPNVNGYAGWRFDSISLGMCTLAHAMLDLSKSERRRVLSLVTLVKHKRLFAYLWRRNVESSHDIYIMVYCGLYRYHLSPHKKLQAIFLWFILLMRNKVHKSARKQVIGR